MERIIHLKGATVTLYEDRIIVEDGSGKNKKIYLIAAFIWLMYAGISIWSYLNGGEDYKIFMTGVGVLLFILNLRWLWLSNASEIRIEEVKLVRFRTSVVGIESLDMRLKNGLQRRVTGIDIVADELRQYFAERGL